MSKTALRILKRLFDTSAASVVLPTVIGAANAISFDKAVVKRCAAMGTALANKTIAAVLVTIEQQVFAKYAHSLFRLFLSELDRRSDRMPIAPEQPPGRCSRPDPGEKMILFLSQHGSTPW